MSANIHLCYFQALGISKIGIENTGGPGNNSAMAKRWSFDTPTVAAFFFPLSHDMGCKYTVPSNQ